MSLKPFVSGRLEHRIERWIRQLAPELDLPLRIDLWNGRYWLLGPEPEVRVRLVLRTPAALPFLLEPSLAHLGEAYVEGLIDVEGALEDIIAMAHRLARRAIQPVGLMGRVAHRYAHARHHDREAIAHHYDVSNAFYQLWLDPEMVYSCAYFESGNETLAQAQVLKLDHILRKIGAGPGHRLLDIGCGWGALVIRAAMHWGCRCVGITLSQEQHDWARDRVAALGLSDRIEIRLQDYRDVQGSFDRITSVGMFEHVGVAHLPDYFATLARLLADGGVALNHGITSTDPDDGQTAFGGGDFIAKYVFPGGELAHIGTVLKAMQRGGLEAWDIESLRRHYARTLRCWGASFEAQAGRIRDLAGEKRYRIWRVYLLGCAHAFEQDEISLYQVVCRKAGAEAGTLPWSRRHMYPEGRAAAS